MTEFTVKEPSRLKHVIEKRLGPTSFLASVRCGTQFAHKLTGVSFEYPLKPDLLNLNDIDRSRSVSPPGQRSYTASIKTALSRGQNASSAIRFR